MKAHSVWPSTRRVIGRPGSRMRWARKVWRSTSRVITNDHHQRPTVRYRQDRPATVWSSDERVIGGWR
jgi:hypothetical protein